MAIEDSHAFLNTSEFGVVCQIGVGDTFVGILDSPMDVIAGRHGVVTGVFANCKNLRCQRLVSWQRD
jgi:hypothetical protein